MVAVAKVVNVPKKSGLSLSVRINESISTSTWRKSYDSGITLLPAVWPTDEANKSKRLRSGES